jgi:hypothetical protein
LVGVEQARPSSRLRSGEHENYDMSELGDEFPKLPRSRGAMETALSATLTLLACLLGVGLLAMGAILYLFYCSPKWWQQ